VSTVINDIR